MPPAGFEPTIPASERPQTHILHHTTIRISKNVNIQGKKKIGLIAQNIRILIYIQMSAEIQKNHILSLFIYRQKYFGKLSLLTTLNP
jgi:hypothetical protein